jgi:5-formyltetrahydrofolate cyclo-ligase
MHNEKNMLRREFIMKCQTLDINERIEYSKKLLANIKPLLDSVNKIAIYHAYGWEINLDPIIDYCIKEQKQLFQPVTYRGQRQMLLMPYDPSVKNIFVEPDYIPPNSMKWYNVDLIILPLVAIDKSGYRLGKGGGYYDATLGNVIDLGEKVPKLCGAGCSIQMYLGDLPKENFDVQLDYFVSENGLISFR